MGLKLFASFVVYTIFKCSYAVDFTLNADKPCFCKKSDLCQPISTVKEKEIFTFFVNRHDQGWRNFDWSRVTTLCPVGFNVTELQEIVCYAHNIGVRVSYYAGTIPKDKMLDPTYRSQWVEEKLNAVSELYMDGANVDYESGIVERDTARRDALIDLMRKLRAGLDGMQKNPQLSFDTPCYPAVSWANYGYVQLAEICDFLFIMSYDENGTAAVAHPNAPLWWTKQGIKEFMALGIPKTKIVMGSPWYGHDYTCVKLEGKVCYTTGKAPEYDYSFIMSNLLSRAIGGPQWDTKSQTPFITYKQGAGYRQIWYDNARSLKYKYNWAVSADIRGVGMWQASALDNSNTAKGRAQRELIWGTMPKYSSRF